MGLARGSRVGLTAALPTGARRYLAKALALPEHGTDAKQGILMDMYLETLRCV